MGGRDASRLSLRARLPEYVAVFGVGLAAASGVGLMVALLFGPAVASAVGYSIVLLGVALVFGGGAAGGGLASYGLGEGVMRRTYAQGSEREYQHTSVDPVERIRRSMRPRANPSAFWQVVGGVLYIVVGLVVVGLG